MANENLSWYEFLSEAKAFIEMSQRLNDSWIIFEKNAEAPNTFLIYKQKLEVQLQKNSAEKTLVQLEYHVVYSISYQVPVLYFQAHKDDGCLLSLEDAWHLFRDFDYYNRNQMLTILTQTDHPVLFRPFLTLHPCRTGELLAQFQVAKSYNRILTFISLVGPYVGLCLPNEYGLMDCGLKAIN